jgi:hypothetical protein
LNRAANEQSTRLTLIGCRESERIKRRFLIKFNGFRKGKYLYFKEKTIDLLYSLVELLV